MIGVGALSAGDDEVVLLLVTCILFAYFGWAGGGLVAASTIPVRHGLTEKSPDSSAYIALAIPTFVIVGAFLVIAGVYGLPAFAEDPSIARLEQRNYGVLMLLIEHGLPLMLGFAVISYQQRHVSGKILVLFMLLGLAISTLLSVRYLFFQAIMVMYVLTIWRMDMKRAIWLTLLALLLATVFFVGVQLLRSGSLLDENMLNRLGRRLFIIHYEIFEQSVHWNGDLPYVTYFNSAYKLMGGSGFNLGFELFNALEIGKASIVQGYAPVSVLGEAMINVQELFGGLLLISTIFFFMRLAIGWFTSFTTASGRLVFHAIVCMMMFRTYSHSLVGFIFSLAVFVSMILIIQMLTRFTEERKKDRRRGVAITGDAK